MGRLCGRQGPVGVGSIRGVDNKLLVDVGERHDLPSIIFNQIEHFFTHYKDLESEKWVRVGRWGDAEDARKVLMEAVERARETATA